MEQQEIVNRKCNEILQNFDSDDNDEVIIISEDENDKIIVISDSESDDDFRKNRLSSV